MNNLRHLLISSILILTFGCSKETMEPQLNSNDILNYRGASQNPDFLKSDIAKINKKLWIPDVNTISAIRSFLRDSPARNSSLKNIEEAIWYTEASLNYNNATLPTLKLRILPELELNEVLTISATDTVDGLPIFSDSTLLSVIQSIQNEISSAVNGTNLHHYLTQIELIDIDLEDPSMIIRYATQIAEAFIDPCGLDNTDHWYNSNRTNLNNPRGKCNGHPNTTWPGYTASWRVSDVIQQNESVFGCYIEPDCPINWPVFHTNVHSENVSGLSGQNGMTHRPALYLDSWNGSTYSCIPPFGTSTYTLNKWVSNYTTDSYQVLSDFNSNNNANHQWASIAIDYANSATNLLQFHWGTYRYGILNCKPIDD